MLVGAKVQKLRSFLSLGVLLISWLPAILIGIIEGSFFLRSQLQSKDCLMYAQNMTINPRGR